MNLLLVRHAEAADSDGELIKRDFDRPLTPHGCSQAKNLGLFLGKCLKGPSLLASSPLVRAHQTAEILKLHSGNCLAAWETWPELGIPADWDALKKRLFQIGEQSVVLVGHMDDIAALAEKLIGSADGSLSFRKGAAALFRWEGNLKWQTARLKWWVDPDILSVIGVRV